MKKKLTLIIVIAAMLALMICPLAAQAANGDYAVTIKGYSSTGAMVSFGTVYVPYGGASITVAYEWDATQCAFIQKVTTTNSSNGATPRYDGLVSAYKKINYRNMNGASVVYTSSATGSGSSTKYLYGNAIYSSAKAVTVNVGTIGSFSTTLSATTYGTYTVTASSLTSQITTLLTDAGYNAADFNFSQSKTTKFQYNGCSAVNFSFNGSAVTPEPTVAPTATAAPTPTVNPDADCQLKIYAYETGAAAGCPTYNNPYIMMVESGQTYTFDPADYNIFPAVGYEYDYYMANGSSHRTIGTSHYIPSGYSGLSIIVVFKVKTVTNTFNVQFVDADGDNVGTALAIPANGNYNTPITINAQTLTLPDGYQLAPATAQRYNNNSYVYTGIYGAPTTVKFVVEDIPAPAPVLVENAGAIVFETATDATRIDTLIVRKGTYATVAAITAGDDYLEVYGEDITDGVIATAAQVITLGRNGTYTVYVLDNDDNAYFITVTVTTSEPEATPVPELPEISVEGKTVKLDNDKDVVDKFGFAYGNWTTLAEMQAAGILYRSTSHTFEADRNGIVTLYTLMEDGNEYFNHITINYFLTPGIENDGFTVYAVENAAQITRFGYASGHFTTYESFYPTARFASTSKQFTATEGGEYTIYCVMQDGGEHFLYITLQEIIPTITVENLLVYADQNANEIIKFGYVLGTYTNYEDFVAAGPRYASQSKQFTATTAGTYTVYIKMSTQLDYFLIATTESEYDITIGNTAADEITVTPLYDDETSLFMGKWEVEVKEDFKGFVTRFGTAYGTLTNFEDFSSAAGYRMASTSKLRTLNLAGNYTVYVKTDDGVMHFIPFTVENSAITLTLSNSGTTTVYATANGITSANVSTFQYAPGTYTYDAFNELTSSQYYSGKTNVRALANSTSGDRPYGAFTVKVVLTTGEVLLFHATLTLENGAAGVVVSPSPIVG